MEIKHLLGIACEIFVPIIVVIFGLSILLIQFIIVDPDVVIAPTLFPIPISNIYSGQTNNSLADTTEMN